MVKTDHIRHWIFVEIDFRTLPINEKHRHRFREESRQFALHCLFSLLDAFLSLLRFDIGEHDNDNDSVTKTLIREEKRRRKTCWKRRDGREKVEVNREYLYSS